MSLFQRKRGINSRLERGKECLLAMRRNQRSFTWYGIQKRRRHFAFDLYDSMKRIQVSLMRICGRWAMTAGICQEKKELLVGKSIELLKMKPTMKTMALTL